MSLDCLRLLAVLVLSCDGAVLLRAPLASQPYAVQATPSKIIGDATQNLLHARGLQDEVTRKKEEVKQLTERVEVGGGKARWLLQNHELHPIPMANCA